MRSAKEAYGRSIRPLATTTGSPSRFEKRGGLGGPIGGEIIVSNYDNHVRRSDAILHDPKTRRQLHQGMPGEIEDSGEEAQRHQGQQAEDDAAALAGGHAFGSSWRSRSAACSGMSALK